GAPRPQRARPRHRASARGRGAPVRGDRVPAIPEPRNAEGHAAPGSREAPHGVDPHGGCVMNCESVRERIHTALDDDAPLDVEPLGHVGTCAGCRALYEDLSALRDSPRALPHEPLPPAALDAVWARTVRSGARPRLASGWRAAAAALIVTLAGWG